jgi:hypothetical protein
LLADANEVAKRIELESPNWRWRIELSTLRREAEALIADDQPIDRGDSTG